MPTLLHPRAWRQRHSRRTSAGRSARYEYIREARRQADAPPLERRLASQVFERPVPTLPTDPFEQLAAEYGLRISVERVSLAPRDLAAPPDEGERCYLISVVGPEGGTTARLAFVRALQDPSPPSVRDALWWLASDAWAVERSGGDISRWAATQRLTLTDTTVVREFDHYSAQSRALALALGADAYQRLLAAYESSVGRAGAMVESVTEQRERQQPRP